jgi:hypothetical protein
VIALACKRLDEGLSAVEISGLSREQVEAGLTFGAFAVFQCPLKEESEPALRMLKVGSLFLGRTGPFKASGKRCGRVLWQGHSNCR